MGIIKHIFICLLISISSYAQKSDAQEILSILDQQTVAWNAGNINEFMKGYWHSDSLMFIGKSGITYGYDNTLNNYKRNYPDTAHMGKLTFHIMKVERLSNDAFFVVGKWQLDRSVGNASGHYSLIFRKIKGKWMIVSDHSS